MAQNLAVKNVFFLPPLAIARVGGSETPLDCFVWDSDRTIHGAHRTVIRPTVSLEVLSDGSLRPYQPNAIQFRDRGLLRPVAPFFELWATMVDGATRPLTSALLEQLGGSLDSIEYSITMANRKAQRRTGSAACAFIARVTVAASDHERKPLLGFSPRNSGEEPLVRKEQPIRMGYLQAIKPIKRRAMNVHLGVLRIRFTPATGQIFGPPDANAGPASPLPQGVALPPVTLGGRLHEIVPPENRILNPNTPWSQHVMDANEDDPQPSDSYDGANVGINRSWGVVDDTGDGIIEAQVVIGNSRHVATARVLSSCPDYAPDRRPFYSTADDLADRDLERILVQVDPTGDVNDDIEYEIADLFERAFETASLFNLDAMRHRSIVENITYSDPPPNRTLPEIYEKSMTEADRGDVKANKSPPYADLTADLFPYPPTGKPVPGHRLRYSEAAQFAHAKLCDIETLIDFLRSKPDRVRSMIRPPFGRFAQLPKRASKQPNPKFRDYRVDRDTVHDMRMPPYMRDSDLNPLSITHRQYDALMQFIDRLQEPPASDKVQIANSPIARVVNDLIKQLAQKGKR